VLLFERDSLKSQNIRFANKDEIAYACSGRTGKKSGLWPEALS
jgi:hypothetical protein